MVVSGTLNKIDRLTPAQIRKVAANAGFSGSDLNIAVAVAQAESGGNPRSHNTNAGTGDDSYGLWQINYFGSLRGPRTADFGPGSGLYDPQKNADAAHVIFKRSGWSAWSTYKSGAYKRFMDDVGVDTPSGGSTSAATPASDGFSIGSSINAFGQTILKTGENIGGILVALVFIVLGVVLLARKEAVNALPVGKALKQFKKVAS